MSLEAYAGLLFAGIMVFSVFFIVTGGRRADLERQRRFSDRTELPLEVFIADCQGSQPLDAELVRQFLREIAESIGIPTGKLRATDRIDVELAPPKGWEIDDSIWPVLDEWEAHGRKRHGRKPEKQLTDLGEIVRWACTR